MWFVDGASDEAPMPVKSPRKASNEPEMWLVDGPSDERPMPLKQQIKDAVAQVPPKRQRTGLSSSGAENSTPKKQLGLGSKPEKAVEAALASLAAEAETESTAVLPALRPMCRVSPVRLALVGATGLVGRACSTYVAKHPELGYAISHFIGSSLSVGRTMAEVADEKEAVLQKHYGEGFWDSTADVDSEVLVDTMVSDVAGLLREGPASCDVVLSFLAPRFGNLEDQMIAAGFRVVSISPHARMAHPLLVPVVNGESVARAHAAAAAAAAAASASSTSSLSSTALQAQPRSRSSGGGEDGEDAFWSGLRCFKSPNCCSVGSCVALLPLVDYFTVQEVFITTFQTLSGRGDALYPPDKVVKNVYPIGQTEEKTELYIAQEVGRVFSSHPRAKERLTKDSLHVSAYRVYVQKNHLLDIKVRVAETIAPASAKSMLAAIYGQVKYSADVRVETEAGLPRPLSHGAGAADGSGADPNRVVVGNFDVEPCGVAGGGGSGAGAGRGGTIIRVSATVDNVGKGAWGNALDITARIVQACHRCPPATSTALPSPPPDSTIAAASSRALGACATDVAP